MKGISFVEQGVTRIVEEPKPQCGPGKILLKTLYSGVSNGTERSFLMGGPYNNSWPCRIGYCNVSEVVETGAGVTKYSKGDILFDASFSGHVEFHLVNEDDLVIKVPDGMDLKEATMLGVACVPFYNSTLSGVTAADHVLVIGAGLVGQFACQSAAAKGAKVTLAEPDEERRELALRYGADEAYHPLTEEGWASISQRAYSVVMECSGANNLEQIVGKAWKSGILAPHGRLNLIAGRDTVSYRFGAASSLYLSIIQSTHFDQASLETVARLAAKKTINLGAVIKDIVPISQSVSVYDTLRDRPSSLMGTVIDWT